jgi:hypothetical protein
VDGTAKRERERRSPVARSLVPVLVAFLALGGSLAWGPAARADDGARVTSVECGILLPGILPEGQVLSTTGRLVLSPSGTATLVCRGQLDPGSAPAAAVVIDDLDCALGEGGQVAESQIRVAPSGEVLLVCHNNPGSEPFDPGPGD